MLEPVLETPRLAMRLHHVDDVPFMLALSSDPEVWRYTGEGPLGQTDALGLVATLAQQYAQRRMGRFMLVDRSTQRQLGWCGLKWLEDTQEVDLGYRLARGEWGKGYATEAAQACVHYGFETLGHTRLVAKAARNNAASIRVLEKLGFTLVGEDREEGMDNQRFELRGP